MTLECALLGMDFPPANLVFLPMAGIGIATAVIGTLKAIPKLEMKFPDLMLKIHKAQLVVCGGLGVCFMIFTHLARNVATYVDDNWEGCAKVRGPAGYFIAYL